ncbi:MAG TPA: putative glycolipid-binding domain-containing protein [Vicinamibacterales bacterium]|jgi:hypothetical protein|nr:putative glycolipid-binding domain-containing protein [Vicinamibacterales bacterium]
MVIFWRRIDLDGLERMTLVASESGLRAVSTIICVEDGGFKLDHTWQLTPDWRAVSLKVERLGANGPRHMTLERDDDGWRVNGERRSDLDEADEPDLSVTPFCNSLPIRRLLSSDAESLTVEVAYVDGKDLTVTRSRQRYDRLGPDRVRFVDLGLSAGFEAELRVDDRMLVVSYEHLFERVG